MAEVSRVVTDTLRFEANRWKHLADDMATVRANADHRGLDTIAFFIGDVSAAVHSAGYDHFKQFMVDAFSGAVTEFEKLAEALERAADLYDRSNDDAKVRASQVFGQ